MTSLLEAYKFYGPDFSARFSGILVLNTITYDWEYFAGVNGKSAEFYVRNDNRIELTVRPLPDLVKYTVCHPDSGYYNCPVTKMAYLFTRMPIRSVKKGSDPGENCYLFSPFWEKLPRAIRGELKPIFQDRSPIDLYLASINNKGVYYNFIEAVDRLVSGKSLSCAINQQFAVAPSFIEDGYCVLYRDNEVGMINFKTETVELRQKQVGQELIDQFKKDKTQWSIK